MMDEVRYNETEKMLMTELYGRQMLYSLKRDSVKQEG